MQYGPPEHHRGSLSVAEFARWSGISRSKTYELIGAGSLKSIKVGRRRLIRMSDAMAWLARLAENSTILDSSSYQAKSKPQ